MKKIKRLFFLLFPWYNFFEKLSNFNKVYCHKYTIITKTIFEGNNYLSMYVKARNCYIGEGTYIEYGSSLEKVMMGKFCSIASNVQIGVSHHPSSVFSTTFPSFYIDTSNHFLFTYHRGENMFDPNRYVDVEKNIL